MTLAIEPMVVAGVADIYQGDDGGQYGQRMEVYQHTMKIQY